MNIYDFDKTIYRGDSSIDFYLFALRKHPSIIACLPRQAWYFLLFLLKRCSRKQWKEAFFGFLARLDDPDALADAFVDKNLCKIMPWYLQIKRPDDLIISASPEFLIKRFCCKLGVRNPIATHMSIRTGRIEGENCRGEEKLQRFRAAYPEDQVAAFYSDSDSDFPLAQTASRAYLIKAGRPVSWRIEDGK